MACGWLAGSFVARSTTLRYAALSRQQENIRLEPSAVGRHGVRRAVVGVLLAIAAASIAMWWLLRLSWLVPVNSDDASAMLQALAMLHENPLLHGWWTPSDSFWPTYLMAMAVGISVRGLNPALMHDVPVLIFTALTILAAIAASRNQKGSAKAWSAAICAAILLTPSTAALPWQLAGPMHIDTIALCVATIIVSSSFERTKRPRTVAILVAVCIALACAADPFTYAIGVLPLAAVAIERMLRGHRHGWPPLLLAAGLSGAVGAVVLDAALKALGAFSRVSLPLQFPTLHRFGANASWLVKGVLALTGGDFFGKPIAVTVVPAVLRAGLCVSVVVVMWRLGMAWLRGRSVSPLDAMLALGAGADVGAFLFTTLAHGAASMRYLNPAVIFGVIGLSRWLGPALSRLNRRLAVIGFGAGLLVLAVNPVVALRRLPDPMPVPAQPLVSYLKAHNLTAGYGAYWDASVVTALSQGAVLVRPVGAWAGRITVTHWLSSNGWYDTPMEFLVFGGPASGGVDAAAAVRTFGAPTHEANVGQYTVLIWKHPIQLAT